MNQVTARLCTKSARPQNRAWPGVFCLNSPPSACSFILLGLAVTAIFIIKQVPTANLLRPQFVQTEVPSSHSVYGEVFNATNTMRFWPLTVAVALGREGRAAQCGHGRKRDGPPTWRGRPQGYEQLGQTSMGTVDVVKPDIKYKQKNSEESCGLQLTSTNTLVSDRWGTLSVMMVSIYSR